MLEQARMIGVAGSGESGTSKRRIQIGISLILGRRFGLLLALFPLGGVIKHGDQTMSLLVGFLVIGWVLTNLVESFLTAFKPSERNDTPESLTVEAGLL
jgi:hypothetical protein